MNALEAASIRARDLLLEALVTRLRERKDMQSLADQIAGLHGIIRKLEEEESVFTGDGARHGPTPVKQAARLLEVAKDRIGIFRTRKRWEHSPSVHQAKKIAWETATAQLETFADEVPDASSTQWGAELQDLWKITMRQPKPLTRKQLDEILAIKKPSGRAFRLLYMAFGNPNQAPEAFRRQMKEVRLKLWP